MNNSNTIAIFRNLSLATGRPVLYELARRAASKFYGISSTKNYLNYRFYDKKLSLWKQYITNNERRVLQFLAVPPEALSITTSKAAFAERCSASNIPIPETKCLLTKENIDSYPGVAAFRDQEKLATCIQSFSDGTYLMKPIAGRYGDGVVKFEVCEGSLVDKNGRDTTAGQLIQDSLSNPFGDSGLIVQRFIHPHSELQPVMNGPGLGTIRCVTLTSPNGDATVAWAVLKLPAGDSITDNFSTGETGNLIAAIDVDNGRILRCVGLSQATGVMEEIVEHPETQATLPGFELPDWRDTLRQVRTAAQTFATFPSLGWDVALSDKGPVFIEMNAYWGCGPVQIAYDKGIREKVLDHYALYGIDLSRYDEILGHLRTAEGRAVERGL